jgi:hypothetical protein
MKLILNSDENFYEVQDAGLDDVDSDSPESFMQALTDVMVYHEFCATLNASIDDGKITDAEAVEISAAVNDAGIKAGLRVVERLHPELFSPESREQIRAEAEAEVTATATTQEQE